MQAGLVVGTATSTVKHATMNGQKLLIVQPLMADGKTPDADPQIAVDAVGAATLPYVLRTLRTGAAVAACGNAGGAKFETTVFPFILRGAALLGMDSVNMAIGRRRELWDRIATDLRPRDLGLHASEVTLDTLDEALDAIVAGGARGRWIVRIGE